MAGNRPIFARIPLLLLLLWPAPALGQPRGPATVDAGATAPVAARAPLIELTDRLPAQAATADEAWATGLSYLRLGQEDQARTWFGRVAQISEERQQKAGLLSTGAHTPATAEPLAAAYYALGDHTMAETVLRRCNAARPKGSGQCGPWNMAEVAAARQDWPAVAQVLDRWLDDIVSVPLVALRLRLQAAEKAGDQAAMGRWRMRILRAGGELGETSVSDAKVPAEPRETSPSAPQWLLILAVGLLLLAVGALAWRRNR